MGIRPPLFWASARIFPTLSHSVVGDVPHDDEKLRIVSQIRALPGCEAFLKSPSFDIQGRVFVPILR